MHPALQRGAYFQKICVFLTSASFRKMRFHRFTSEQKHNRKENRKSSGADDREDFPSRHHNFSTNNALIALSTAITITPTSAKMASHIPAMPSAPSSRQISFMPIANTMFS